MRGSPEGRIRVDGADLQAVAQTLPHGRRVVTHQDVALGGGSGRAAVVAVVLLFGTMLALLATLAGGAIYVSRAGTDESRPMSAQVRIAADEEQKSIQRGDLRLVAPLVRGGVRARLASPSEWLGSAIPWRVLESGHLLLVTNAHVARPGRSAEAARLSVEFASGVSAPVVDVALPEGARADLALMLVSMKGLSAGIDFELLTAQADDEWAQLEIGEDVVVVGSAHGYPQTQTFGRISAVRTTLPGRLGSCRWIQFDATVLPGNSGGPLLQRDADQWRWIGVVTARGPERIGLAIHTSELERIAFRWIHGNGSRSP